jgi:hypothetical protein
MTTPAFADMGDTIGNTLQENQTILESLEGLYGENVGKDEVTAELYEMGLLDEGEELVVSKSIMVDGTPMTLAQVMAMIEDEDVDLSRKVSVDGTDLTLEDLKTMIEIEEEIARLKETYFSNTVPFTEEHEATFDSLMNQIENEGIVLMGDTLSAEVADMPINHDIRLKMSGFKVGSYVETEDMTLTFSLVDLNGSPVDPLGYPVSFDWHLLDGSAKKGINYYWSSGVEEGTVTIEPGQTSVSAVVKIDFDTHGNENEFMRWNGDKTFLVQLSNPVNVLFEGGTRVKDFPIHVYNDYVWTIEIVNTIIGEEIENVTGSGINFIFENNDLEELKYSAEDISDSYIRFSAVVGLASEGGGEMTMKPKLVDSEGNEVESAGYGNVYYYPETDDDDHHERPTYTFIVSSNEINPPKMHLEAIFPGDGKWPVLYEFMVESYYNGETEGIYPISFVDCKDMNGYICRASKDLELIDVNDPSVEAITAPEGTYVSGQTIPITVEFTELVRYANVSVIANDSSTQVEDGRISKYATYLYTIPDSPNTLLEVDSVNNISDPLGAISVDWPGDGTVNGSAVAGVEMKEDPLLAFESISLEPEGVETYAIDSEIHIRLDINTDYSNWIEEAYNFKNNYHNSVYLKAGGLTYPLTMGGVGDEEGSFYTALIPAWDHVGTSVNELVIEVCHGGSNDGGDNGEVTFSGGNVVVGLTATADISPMVLVESIELEEESYPADNTIYVTDTVSTQLSAVVNPSDATYPDIYWESSDESIADISSDGVIAPVSPGTVFFRAVALNGGHGEPVYSDPTPDFTVDDSGKPAIVFPEGNDIFVTKKGEDVKVTWSHNLDSPVSFGIELFEGYHESIESLDDLSPVYTGTVEDTNTGILPGDKLTEVSDGTEPAYTLKVSSYVGNKVLSDLAYIVVYPQQAKVAFEELDDYFITDETTSIGISWNLSDFEGGEFSFEVKKNGDTVVSSTDHSQNSYALSIQEVAEGDLKDIYNVSVMARNTMDPAWSTDSFILNVYNDDSMKILVDGEDLSTVVMDNNPEVSAMNSEAILALNRNIDLKNFIGINYGDYPWGSVADRIQWESSDSGIASVNYKQGTYYENVEKYDYTSYRPSTEFMLAGNSEGETAITAIHSITGMQDTLDVNVKTLKDKLYIFNFYPKQLTELTYTNGEGVVKQLTSNSNGEIAVYEESGIASDIGLRSGTTDDLYLGILFNNKLVTEEKNPGQYELYPVNIFKVRPAAKVELFFKDSNGEPFSGDVTYRGAVYKNGGLCFDTMNKDGELLTIGSDGSFTLNLNTDDFWVDAQGEELSSTDRMEFIYEVFADGYYPGLITVNGDISVDDTVRFGESVVNLKPVDGNEAEPFLQYQVLDYGLQSGRKLDVTEYKGSIGPSDIYPAPELETLVAWWGENKEDGYGLEVEDEYGSVIEGQQAKTLIYPFATLAYTVNKSTLDENVLNLGIGEKKGAAVSLYGTDGSLVSNSSSSFTFTNMVGAPSLDDEESGVKNEVHDLLDSGDMEFNITDSFDDNIIGKAITLMGGASFGNQCMNLQLIPTEDPLYYRGLITITVSTPEDEASIDIGDVSIDIGSPDDAADKEEDKLESDEDKEDDDKKETEVKESNEYSVSITGYYEVEVGYDISAGKWSMVFIGGGMDLETSIAKTLEIKGYAGPVPVFLDIGIGAEMKLEFRAIKPYGMVPEDIDAAEVSDFLTALRLRLYLEAFGGVGIDFSVVSLKIGLFGKIDMNYNNEMLIRTYLETYNQLMAQDIVSNGQVGAKFVAKFLFVSYEKVIASVGYEYYLLWGLEYPDGSRDLIDDWKDNQPSSLIDSASCANLDLQSLAANDFMTVSEDIDFEGREYLTRYDRNWGSTGEPDMKILSLGMTSVEDIQSNAYPYSNPLVTRDGVIMAYMSDGNSEDLNETRASWAKRENGVYTDHGPISPASMEDAYADNNLKLDGTGDFAVATWEQQGIQISTTEEAITNDDLAAMINSSDIMASVYDGNEWTTTVLSDNMVPDLAPVAAANGSRAIVAWRNVAGSDMQGDPWSYDDEHDSILYRIFDDGEWSDTYTLYNGTSGNVKGMNAAMMPDGTAAVVYTLDRGSENENASYGHETMCAVVGYDNKLISEMRLTNNELPDVNPQIVVAEFGESEGDKFVIGWYNVDKKGLSDIKFTSVDNDGNIYDGFIDSISSVNRNSAVDIGDNFRFVKGEDLGIEDLALIWTEELSDNYDTIDESIVKDCLKAVKFMSDAASGKIYLTAALDVAMMEDYTVVDHFDAYKSGDDMVSAVMLASAYVGEPEYQGDGIYTVEPVCAMKYASVQFTNDIDVKDININHNEIRHDFRLPMQFTVANMGISPINSIGIVLDPDVGEERFENLNILPNQEIVCTAHYDVPGEDDEIHDLEYTVSATFKNGDTAEKSGSLNLDVPDTGISRLELVSDEQGERILQATLNNSNDVSLAGRFDRRVYAGLYTSSEFVDATEVEVKEITGQDLDLLDKGALTKRFSYQVPLEGIPKGGTRLYARIWVEEQEQDGLYDDVIEYCQSNNDRSILLPNPIEANNGERFLVTVEQKNDGASTVATITVKNLSMEASANGNIIVSLMNAGGGVIESRLLAHSINELISFNGEESKVFDMVFDEPGARVAAEYFTVEVGETGISDISLSEIEMDFDSLIPVYDLMTENLPNTLLTVIGKGMDDVIEIRNSSGEVLASGNGSITHELQLPYGDTSIQVLALTSEGLVTETYNITVDNIMRNDGVIFIEHVDTQNKSAAITATAENLTGFIPVKWKYVNNGTWSEFYDWKFDKKNKFAAAGSGTLVIQVRLFDAEGYYMDSNIITIER